MWADSAVTAGASRGLPPPRRPDASGARRAAPRLPTLAALLLAALAGACGFKSPGATGDPTIDAADPDAAGPDAAGPDAAVDAAPAAWLTGWAHRKPITLRASQIEAPGNGALTDFPVLLSVTDAQIGAGSLSTTGADIVFTAADGTTLLASEIEAFSTATHQLVAWIKVPSLSATIDTPLYVYYGNATPPARTPEDTWTASFLGVWHLNQDPGSMTTSNILDSTANNQDSTSRNMQSNELSAAQIGLGLDLDGTNDFLEFPSADLGNSFTISMWASVANGSNNIRTLIANSGIGLNTDGFRFFVNTAGSMDRRLVLETGNGAASGTARTNTNAITFGVLTHVAVVVNRAMNTAALYVNGASVATTTTTAASFAVNSAYNAGRMTDSSYLFAGKLDEIEIAKAARPAEWIKTAYNNQSQPSSFHALGPEEQAP